MAPRQCPLCDRKFSKTEHLRRHERSHTKERPYECPTCHKLFARSDVLCRHRRGHDPDNSDSVQARLNTKYAHRRDQPSNHHEDVDTIAVSTSGDTLSSPGSRPPLASQPHVGHASEAELVRLNDSTTPSLTGDHIHALRVERSAEASCVTAEDPPQRQDEPITSATSAPGDWSTHRPFDAVRHSIRLENANVTGSAPHVGFIGSGNIVDKGLQFDQAPSAAGDVQGWQPQAHDGFSTFPTISFQQSNLLPESFADLSQFWLHQTEPDPMVQSILRDISMTPYHVPNLGTAPVTAVCSPAGDRTHTALMHDHIPPEIFLRAQKRWHPWSRKSQQGNRDFWRSIIRCPRSNLVCVETAASQAIDISRRRPKLNEACHQRIEAAISGHSASHILTPDAFFDIASPSSFDRLERHDGVRQTRVTVPPTEIFDIAFDVYFGQFHPTLPIIHSSTFVPENIPTSLLLAMCSIGFHILGTTGVKQFVAQTFSTITSMVATELHMNTMRPVPSEQLLTTMITALLTLHIACVSGRRGRVMEVEPLYIQLLASAQWYGLVSVKDEGLVGRLLSEIPETDARWKAWGRVESVKRLILGIIEIDCWFAMYLSTEPVIRSDVVRVMVPSNKKLFALGTASKWAQLYNETYTSSILTMAPFDRPIEDADLDSPALRTKLTLIQLRICEAYQKLDMRGDERVLEPVQEIITSHANRSLVDDITAIVSNNMGFPQNGDIDGAILWHSSCINLASNVRIFELAAGRGGPDAATEALRDIAMWSRSRAARRACIHAGEVYKTLLDRKVSDIVSMHSAMALFKCALVLGFYIMTATAGFSGDQEPTVEIVDHFDWSAIGSHGLTPDGRSRDDLMFDEATSSAIDFIQHGGQLSIYGYIHNDGFVSARRTILHFADLMEGMGKWKSRAFSEILHIISDDLMDIQQDDGDN